MTMFGDPAANAPVWGKYAVLLGGLTATVPTGNAAFDLNAPPTTTDEWDAVGALDADTPFDNGSETVETTDHTAAGFGVFATTYKNQKETVSFTAKETTLVTLGLIYDVSDLTTTSGNISGTLKRRDPTKKYLVAFHRENGTKCERRISKNFATVENVARNFGSDESTCTVTMTIIPTSDNELYDYYLGAK